MPPIPIFIILIILVFLAPVVSLEFQDLPCELKVQIFRHLEVPLNPFSIRARNALSLSILYSFASRCAKIDITSFVARCSTKQRTSLPTNLSHVDKDSDERGRCNQIHHDTYSQFTSILNLICELPVPVSSFHEH